MSKDTREQLAAYAHEAWSGWMRYLFSKCEPSKRPTFAGDYTMPAWAVERWQRQMNTPYADLPESEKENDREEADKMLEIIGMFYRRPNLENAPAWASAWAIDNDGSAYWFERRPEYQFDYGHWDDGSAGRSECDKIAESQCEMVILREGDAPRLRSDWSCSNCGITITAHLVEEGKVAVGPVASMSVAERDGKKEIVMIMDMQVRCPGCGGILPLQAEVRTY